MYQTNQKSQSGFTMIELLIALALGLLVAVAATQVYIMSVRTSAIQQSGSNILDANVFGLQSVERNLRLAGLDLADKSNLNLNQSGIITSINNLQGVSGFQTDWVSASTKASLPTNTSRVGSDQLTIQYRAPTDMRDCEGQLIIGPRKGIVDDKDNAPIPVLGQIVIERYFLAKNSNGYLELRCDAGRYITDNIIKYEDNDRPVPDASRVLLGNQRNQLLDFGDAGTLIISGIDDFKLQYAVTANGATGVQYVSPAQYASGGNQNIVAVKMAILARGLVPAGGQLSDNPSYEMLGETVQLKKSDHYIRRVYESNSMLRNSRERN